MLTEALATKQATREYCNRVFPSFFRSPSDGNNYHVSTIQEKSHDFELQRSAITYALKNLLPIEEGSRDPLEQRLEAIDSLLAALKPRAHQYPILSTEPLTWRDKRGYPRLVLMALDQDGSVEMKVGSSYRPLGTDKRYKDIYERVVLECYDDVFNRLDERCPQRGTLSITMVLGELLIPPSAREAIANARQFFGDQLFLIAEANTWVENEIVFPDPDPLVVGYADGLMFLVCDFDLKHIEELAIEFTQTSLVI